MSQFDSANAMAEEARSLWASHNLFEAKNVVEKIFENFDEIDAKTHMLAGIIYREIGDVSLSIKHFETCKSMITPEMKPLLMGSLYYNLASAFWMQGRLSETLNTFSDALSEFENERMFDFCRKTMQNIAWVAIDMKNFQIAEVYLEKASLYCDSKDANCRQDLTQAYLDFATSKHSSTLKICESLFVDAETPLDVRSIASSLVAEIGIINHQYEEAKNLLNISLDLAVKNTNDSRCYYIASKVIAKLNAALQNGV